MAGIERNPSRQVGCFNGARPWRPGRGAMRWMAVAGSPWCFNGARPWRPGRAGDRMCERCEDDELQRGPALEAGKGRSATRTVMQDCTASTGPGLGGREGGRRTAAGAPAERRFNGARPWRPGRGTLRDRRAFFGGASTGPGLGGREGPTATPTSPAPAPCFNGARPWRPGRGEQFKTIDGSTVKLQRGPALEAGKGEGTGGALAPHHRLQRGPALEAGKGGRLEPLTDAVAASTGPGLGGREGTAAATRACPRSWCFNGARPWRPGRVVGGVVEPPSAADASTGPGLGGREGWRSAGTLSRRRRFNGARPWRPGRAPSNGCEAPASRGFNGARPWRPGRGPPRHRRRGPWAGFNGARPWRPGREDDVGGVAGHSELQRGPALEAGKGRTLPRSPRTRPPCFNGARPWRPGRGARRCVGCLGSGALQRGPALEAGKGCADRRAPPHRRRFNGARPWRPGRATWCCPRSRASAPLQRGPALEAGKGLVPMLSP